MLIGLVGVSGVGKSFFKDKIVENFGFDKIRIVTTREMRAGEVDGEDKIFVSDEEFNNLNKLGKIAFGAKMLGNSYAYLKEELFTNKNTVFEVHYKFIQELKKICPNLKTIYVYPQSLEIPKQKARERHSKPEVLEKRLLEIDEHYNKIKTDKNLQSQFDYYFNNNYDEDSVQRMLKLVKEILNENKG